MIYRSIILTAMLTLSLAVSRAQDTFSIVAVDRQTGEVGSAGASCVDLFQAGIPTDDFLGQLFPGVGAINTQAYYLPANQHNAATRMNLGDTPTEIIEWLAANDVQNTPQLRQYGIVALVDGQPLSAGYTGTSTDDYKNHVTGPGYSIQGNILLGQEILDSMEARYLRAEGDLACRLMEALQGAKVVGADTRCSSNGSSSLFAFVKVAQPTDSPGSPSFLVSTRSSNGNGVEPIDVLQAKFDVTHSCTTVSVSDPSTSRIQLYPNPSSNMLNLSNAENYPYMVEILDANGKILHTDTLIDTLQLDISSYPHGRYTARLTHENRQVIKVFVVQ